MKICPNCRQTFSDENLNFCLNDGGLLAPFQDNPNPTIIMDQPRRTNPNWSDYQAPRYDNQQISNRQNFGMQMPPPVVYGTNQTLPTVSMIFGIIGFLTMCCWGGIPFGVIAMITGYLGFTNSKEFPQTYGGNGLAIAGMVLGTVSFFITLIFVIISIL